jgi:hypothetical protein
LDVKSGMSVELRRPASLLLSRTSVEDWLSLGCSCMLSRAPSDREVVRYTAGESGLTSRLSRVSRVPALAGWGVVERGFGLTIGASEGCGGGVARCRSSFNTYNPGQERVSTDARLL